MSGTSVIFPLLNPTSRISPSIREVYAQAFNSAVRRDGGDHDEAIENLHKRQRELSQAEREHHPMQQE